MEFAGEFLDRVSVQHAFGMTADRRSALCEKALSQGAKAPSLVALLTQIDANLAAYYAQFEANNKALSVTDWLILFT